jgi:GNAT superfamily N-acetyltransferase
MALMPAALEVVPERPRSRSYPAHLRLNLNKLFVEPRQIRSGVGRALLAHAVAEARQRGAERLTILADPNSAGFYERNGAVRIR